VPSRAKDKTTEMFATYRRWRMRKARRNKMVKRDQKRELIRFRKGVKTTKTNLWGEGGERFLTGKKSKNQSRLKGNDPQGNGFDALAEDVQEKKRTRERLGINSA